MTIHDRRGRAPRGLWPVTEIPPEIPVAAVAFFLHFAWEILQAPAFVGMAELPHLAGILACARATLGDVVITLGAFWATALAARSRLWIVSPSAGNLALFLAVGILVTVGLEYHATEIAGRWAYGEVMPVLPLLGTGLLPMLQWIVLPPVVLKVAKRLLPGGRRGRG